MKNKALQAHFVVSVVQVSYFARNALRKAKKWLKLKDMQINEYDEEEIRRKLCQLTPNKLCLHCVHRKRMPRHIFCEMQPSKHSKSGYVTIKAHDCACGLYEQRL